MYLSGLYVTGNLQMVIGTAEGQTYSQTSKLVGCCILRLRITPGSLKASK